MKSTDPIVPELPGVEPRADVARLKDVFQRFKKARAALQPKQWALDLQERERRGERLSDFEQNAWRQALRGADTQQVGGSGTFTPITGDTLPPAMRRRR